VAVRYAVAALRSELVDTQSVAAFTRRKFWSCEDVNRPAATGTLRHAGRPVRFMWKLSSKLKDRAMGPAIWPLFAITVLMLAVSIASVQMVSWTRAYAGGLATWVAAENHAAYDLHEYAESGDEAAYARYRRELVVPLKLGAAREALQAEHPDQELARRAFLAGRIPPEDAPGLIHMFIVFKHHPLMVRAIDIWSEADGYVRELQRVGGQLHDEYSVDAPRKAAIDKLARQADRVHALIGPLTTDFGNTVGNAARQIVALLMIVMPLFAAGMVAAGVAVIRFLNQRAKRDARELRELTERLEHQATHDSLTGLANRRGFEALLASAIEERLHTDRGCALLYFDLDQIKVVNDSCGHAAGDELIRQVAWRVQRLAGEGSTMGRLGGDEFALLLRGMDGGAAVEFAERVREQLSDQRFYWNGKTFAVSASIGVLVLDRNVPSVTEALSAADQACYMAKDNGRNRVQLFRPDDRALQQRRGELHWVERLQVALDHDGFELVAQEIRPLAYRARAGKGQPPPRRRFELLLRMIGPDGQMVAPMAFIPAAERYGLMPRVDRWVIARACRELAALRDGGKPLPTCMINLSGASASDPELADYVAECLRQNGIAGEHVGFELTETAAVGNLSACSKLMSRLRGLGCLIALDDFGTGMSSFSYLRSLPIDLLKIDRAFIRNIDRDPIDHALVETIHRIGGIMGVRTVAEGVESESILGALALIGVDFAQGWHVRRPVPLVQINEEFVQTGATSNVRHATLRRASTP
jgi:diguanylate cyclase (GGDEF)-like protein